jgi:hypothetical protein
MAALPQPKVKDMAYVLLRFIEKWLEEGRFPREELRGRWWILASGAMALTILAVAIVLHARA